MIAVVTGSTGFIGSHLVDALLARGVSVRALFRRESPKSKRDQRIEGFEVDVSDASSVRDSAVWDGATHVFHLGGVTKRNTLSQFRAGNVIPTAHILAALAKRTPTVERFVLVSSQAAAGPARAANAPVTEADTPHPIEAYGQSKLEGEVVAHGFENRLPVTIIRPGGVYGPRDVDFLNVFREASHPVAFYAAPNTQEMSMIFVSDLVHALLLAADSPAAVGRTYFVAGNDATTWKEFYAKISELAGVTPVSVQVPGPLLALGGLAAGLLSLLTGRPFLLNPHKVSLSRANWWLCDSARIQRELGWQAQTSIEQGVRETYLWYLEAGWLRSTRVAARVTVNKTEGRV